MTPFLALAWREDDAAAVEAVRPIKAALSAHSAGWHMVIETTTAIVAVQAAGSVQTGLIDGRPVGVAGAVFAQGSVPTALAFDGLGSFRALCCHLTQHFWGSYIAFHAGGDGALSVFRDPVGMRDCVTWQSGRLRVVATDPGAWLDLFPSRGVELDWNRIAALLGDGSTVFEQAPLKGMRTVPAGALVQFGATLTRSERLWEPRRFCDLRSSRDAAPGELRALMSQCLFRWHEAFPASALEISGGFDSAVVASAALPAGKRPQAGFHFHTDDLAGDERAYARAVEAASGVPLTEVFMPVRALNAADIEDLPIGVRPGIGSATLFHDRQIAALAGAAGASALFTGHGGDSVFFQHATPLIARDRAFPAMSPAAWRELARWCRVPFWTVAGHAMGLGRFGNRAPDDEAMALLPLDLPVADTRSDWAGDLSGLPPAKRMQIEAIAADRGAFGPSLRSTALTMIHPLLSQPLIEYALGLDVYTLTRGKRDRAFAREAFGCFLPRSVAARRGKGSLTHFFGRTLAMSVPFLRSTLLDGLLTGQGVLDRRRLEPMLDRDFLMQTDCYGRILSALLMEHWVRGWSARLLPPAPHGPRPVEAPRMPCPAR